MIVYPAIQINSIYQQHLYINNEKQLISLHWQKYVQLYDVCFGIVALQSIVLFLNVGSPL